MASTGNYAALESAARDEKPDYLRPATHHVADTTPSSYLRIIWQKSMGEHPKIGSPSVSNRCMKCRASINLWELIPLRLCGHLLNEFP